MKKSILTIFVLSISIFANPTITDNSEVYTLKIKSDDFENRVLKLKDEITYNSYKIVHNIHVAKAINIVAKSLNKKSVVDQSTNFGICKPSFAYEFISENFHNISYCPLNIAIYEKDAFTYYTFRKYRKLNDSDKMYQKINEELKEIILNAAN